VTDVPGCVELDAATQHLREETLEADGDVLDREIQVRCTQSRAGGANGVGEE